MPSQRVAEVTLAPDQLAGRGYSGEEVRDGIIIASDFAQVDPYRAATHNKGVMNGIDAVVLATGNDWRAIEAGDATHGASIHFVTEELDGGPVISQVTIAVADGDSPESLAARLSPQEHRLVVATVEHFARHRVECSNGRVLVDGDPIDWQRAGFLPVAREKLRLR